MQKSPNENDGSSHGDTYLIFLISILAFVIIPFSLLPLPDLSTIDLITRRLRQPIATPSTVPWTRRHRHRTLPTRRSSSSKGGRQEQHRRMDHRWSLQEGQRGRRARQPIMDKDRQRHHQDEDPLSRWKRKLGRGCKEASQKLLTPAANGGTGIAPSQEERE